MRPTRRSSSGNDSAGESTTSGSRDSHSVSHSWRSRPGSRIPPVYRASAPSQTRFRLGPVNVLVVGSGGREHALAWKLAQSSALEELHAAPGNPGIARLGRCHPVRADDAEALLDLSRQAAIDLVVVGPEAPLVAG